MTTPPPAPYTPTDEGFPEVWLAIEQIEASGCALSVPDDLSPTGTILRNVPEMLATIDVVTYSRDRLAKIVDEVSALNADLARTLILRETPKSARQIVADLRAILSGEGK